MSLGFNGVGSSCLSASFRKESAGRFTLPLLNTFFILTHICEKGGQGIISASLVLAHVYYKKQLVRLEGTEDEATANFVLCCSFKAFFSFSHINPVPCLPLALMHTFSHLCSDTLPHPPWLIVKAGQCLSPFQAPIFTSSTL